MPASTGRPAPSRPIDPGSGASPEPTGGVRWLDDEEKRAWLALLEVSTGLFELLDRDLKGLAELTLEDYEILHLLSEADEQRLRVGQLVDRMLASRTRLSQRIDRLTRRDLVRRERCPDDGRAINVVLTDEGQRLLADVAPEHLLSVRARVFDHLTRTDVISLGRSLEKLAHSIRERRGRHALPAAPDRGASAE